ncbi:MAG TPA: FAD-dependent oxidoreductase [Chitinophagaceae bacterium]|nr:FAD-dependent oxidoreductase [Chitinophagales bacterium]HRX92656.1 FAD-dependent oxidoreductase [Chitinophagaceae bacterium]
MQKIISLRLLPSEAASETAIKDWVAKTEGINVETITGFTITKRSIDARSRNPLINLQLKAYINEPFTEREVLSFHFPDVRNVRHSAIIIGGGPAGIFAALQLIEKGIKPIILERGKDVRARRRDLAKLNKEGEINPESNYCYGEGGAGTYSDGKLYTRSNKRGSIDRVLNLFVHFGADENILYEAHPHIGTNKLPGIITAMRMQIIAAGGEFVFEKKVTDLIINEQRITGVKTADGNTFEAHAVILATGHSARDIYELLYSKKILLEAKPFALGVRVEHPQSLIDSIQYHCSVRNPYLPPASYSWVEQVNEKGVFSFCMCPGGIIAPAATSPGELVVNGWSPSKRNNPFANSGIVVATDMIDYSAYKKYGTLAGMFFQRAVEIKAFNAGGGKFVAPAQRLTDFIQNKVSNDLPDCSYLPGIRSAALGEVLPGFVHKRLQTAFLAYGKKMKGYITNEALVVATESRTSSPVRIPRNKETMQHPQIKNLYPCGEGAGYAGGIVSAAMDGEKVALQIAAALKTV